MDHLRGSSSPRSAGTSLPADRSLWSGSGLSGQGADACLGPEPVLVGQTTRLVGRQAQDHPIPMDFDVGVVGKPLGQPSHPGDPSHGGLKIREDLGSHQPAAAPDPTRRFSPGPLVTGGVRISVGFGGFRRHLRKILPSPSGDSTRLGEEFFAAHWGQPSHGLPRAPQQPSRGGFTGVVPKTIHGPGGRQKAPGFAFRGLSGLFTVLTMDFLFEDSPLIVNRT